MPHNKDYKTSSRTAFYHAESGSILTVLLAGIALAGLLSFTVYGILNGPVRSAAIVTMKTKAQSEMILAAKLLNRASSDTDADTIFEPPEFDPAADPKPTGGGGIPLTVGANKKDPWNIAYGYCVWDHGTTNASANRLVGNVADYADKITVAIISAGPNRIFETTCADDPTYITSTADSDDIVERYTFEQIEGLGDQLWEKLTDPGMENKIRYTQDSVVIGNIPAPSAAALQVAGDSDLSGNVNLAGNITSTGGAVFAGGINSTAIGNTNPAAGAFTNLVGNGVIAMTGDGGGGINNLPIGNSTASTGNFTALTGNTGTFTGAVAADSAAFTNAVSAASGAFAGTITVGADTLVTDLNADLLDGQHGAYYTDAANMSAGVLDPNRLPAFTGDVSLVRTDATSAATTVVALRNNPIAVDVPAPNTVLGWDGAAWKPMPISVGGGTPGTIIGAGGVNYLATDTNITPANCPLGFVPVSSGATWSCVNGAALGGDTINFPLDLAGTDATGRIMTHNDGSVYMGYKVGSHNLYLGYRAGRNLDTTVTPGTQNTLIGRSAGQSITTANYITALGASSAYTLDATCCGVYIGAFSGYRNGAAVHNTMVGYHSGYENITGVNNVYVGAYAGKEGATARDVVAIGMTAGRYNTANDGVFVGSGAGFSNTTGQNNTYIGNQSGYNANSNSNVFIGHLTGYGVTTAPDNVLIGNRAGQALTSGGESTFIGSLAGLKNTTGIRNTFIGYEAGKENISGESNVYIGRAAGRDNISGSNVYVGRDAGMTNTSGTENIMIGREAGQNSGTARDSVFLGFRAGITTTGSRNVFVGRQAGLTNTTGSSNVLIGYDMTAPAATTSNYLAIGYGATDRVLYGDMVTGNLTVKGTLTAPSDRRLKTDIVDLKYDALETVGQLRGVTYKWKPEYKEDPHVYIGLIAQDVQKVIPEVIFPVASDNVLLDGDKEMLTVSYEHIVPLLIEAVKELHAKLMSFIDDLADIHAMIKAQDAVIEQQQKQIDTLEKRLIKLEAAHAAE